MVNIPIIHVFMAEFCHAVHTINIIPLFAVASQSNVYCLSRGFSSRAHSKIKFFQVNQYLAGYCPSFRACRSCRYFARVTEA
jgi:hypothetical protein